MSIASAMAGMATEKKRGGSIAEAASKPEGGEREGGSHSQLHPHGDGSYHTVTSDGEKTEHPHIGHALMHLAAHHDGEAKHMHVHDDGTEQTTHQVGEDGQVQGPHSHENIEALKQHLEQFFSEEGQEKGEGLDRGERGGHESLFSE